MRSFSSTNLWPLPKAARLPSSVQAAVLQLHHCTDPFGPILPALSTQAGLCHRRAKVKRKNVTSYCFFSIICCCFSVFVEIKKLRTKLQRLLRLSTLCLLCHQFSALYNEPSEGPTPAGRDGSQLWLKVRTFGGRSQDGCQDTSRALPRYPLSKVSVLQMLRQGPAMSWPLTRGCMAGDRPPTSP